MLFLVLCSVAFSIPSFDQWMIQFEKTEYALDAERYAIRKKVYEANVEDIKDINSQNLTWEAGVNAYTDLTWEEFKEYFHLNAPQDCSATNGRPVERSAPLPDNVYWIAKGAVTKVKNQGSCGSCWAFSTTVAVESAWQIAGNPLTELAEQQLVDCAGGPFKNHGCNGGLPSQAFQYIMWAGGQEKGSDYKYTAKDGSCKFSASKVAAKIVNEFNVTKGDESDVGLPAAVAETPTSICYQVVSDFRNYKKGVYTSTKCKNGAHDVNHAVLATGYGKDGTTPHYHVKNSWGTSFGMSGYFNIIRGKNMCGIATCSSFPQMK